MKQFNSWLSMRINEGDSNEASYIPVIEKKIGQLKRLYKDLGTGAATGPYDMLAKEVQEIMENIEKKIEYYEGLVQHMNQAKDI